MAHKAGFELEASPSSLDVLRPLARTRVDKTVIQGALTPLLLCHIWVVTLIVILTFEAEFANTTCLGSELDEVVDTLRAQLASGDFEKRAEAANRLRRLGPKARDAIPELLNALLDPAATSEAKGQDSVGAVSLALSNVAPPEFLVKCLDLIASPPKGTHPHQIELLYLVAESLPKSTDPKVGEYVARIVGDDRDLRRDRVVLRILPRAPYAATVPHLIEMLKSEKKYDRLMAATAFNGFGSEAAEAIPFLDRMFRNPATDIGVRTLALRSIGAIGRNSENCDGFLLDLAKDRSAPEEIRREAIFGLGNSTCVAIVMPNLLKLAASEPFDGHGPGEDFGGLGIAALASIQSVRAREEDVPRLLQMLSRVDKGDNRQIEVWGRAIASAGPAGRVAVPVLLDLIKDDRLTNRPGRIVNLGRNLVSILGHDRAIGELHALTEQILDEGRIRDVEWAIEVLKKPSERGQRR